MRASALLLLFLASVAHAADDWPSPSGPYLGQTPPGVAPEIFAAGLVSLPESRELNSVFSPSGRIFMFTCEIDGVFKMFFSYQRDDGSWTAPRMAGPSRTYPGHRDADMAFSPSAEWVYFISDRPLEGYSLDRYNIWRSRYSAYGLVTPEPLGAHINGPGNELYPTLVADGSLYFSALRDDNVGGLDIFRAQYEDGAFAEPVRLGEGVNSPQSEGDVFVSPDESYLIHVSSGRPDGLGGSDLYISFREPDGSWGQGVHLGDGINSPEAHYCPVVSPDGQFFFLHAGRGPDVGRRLGARRLSPRQLT